jgi:arginine decarboxylase
MLHFHNGPQVTAIRAHKDAFREAGHIYTELHSLGAPMRLLDVGGGLGVDYDGSQTNFHSSMNYTTQEYAYDVVSAVRDICDEKGVPHPDIVTEAGRALVSHASVLIFDVLGVDGVRPTTQPATPGPDEPKVIQQLHEVLLDSLRNVLSYNDALQLGEEATTAFSLGYPACRPARMEELSGPAARRSAHRARDRVRAGRPEAPGAPARRHLLRELPVFQSLPDSGREQFPGDIHPASDEAPWRAPSST